MPRRARTLMTVVRACGVLVLTCCSSPSPPAGGGGASRVRLGRPRGRPSCPLAVGCERVGVVYDIPTYSPFSTDPGQVVIQAPKGLQDLVSQKRGLFMADGLLDVFRTVLKLVFQAVYLSSWRSGTRFTC